MPRPSSEPASRRHTRRVELTGPLTTPRDDTARRETTQFVFAVVAETWVRKLRAYDETGGKHNLIGIVRAKPAYLKRYSKAFPEPTRVGEYDLEIDDDAPAVVRARLKAAHKARRADRATYDTARRHRATGDNTVCVRRRRGNMGPQIKET